MPSVSVIPSLPTYATAPPTNSTLVQGDMPPMYLDAIRDSLFSTLQSQVSPMQPFLDGLSNQFSCLHTSASSEVKAVCKKVENVAIIFQ